MVAVLQDLGDGQAEELRWAGVVGVVEQAAREVGGGGHAVGAEREGFVLLRLAGLGLGSEALEADGVGIAEDAGEQTDDGVEDDGRGQLAAREDVVADG